MRAFFTTNCARLPVLLVAGLGICACLAFGHEVDRRPKRSARFLPDGSEAAELTNLTENPLSRIRRLMLAGQSRAAISEARGFIARRTSDPRDRAAASVYVALSAHALGDQSGAVEWLRNAFAHSGDSDSLLRFLQLMFLQPPVRNSDSSDTTLASLNPAASVLLTAGGQVTSSNLSESDLLEVQKALDRVKREFQKRPTLSSRIELMSWTLLHADLMARDGRWDTTSQGLATGARLLEEVDAEIGQQGGVDELLQSSPEVVMHLDAMRLQVPRLVALQNQALQTGAARLDALRTLLRQYRRASGDLLTATTQFLLDDHVKADESVRDGRAALTEIEQTIRTHAVEHGDDWLLGGEPESEEQSRTRRNQAPFTPSLFSQLNAIQALMSLRPAQQRLVEVREAKSAAEASAVLQQVRRQFVLAQEYADACLNGDAGQAGDPENPLGHFIRGAALEGLAVTHTASDPASEGTRQAARDLFQRARQSLKVAQRVLKPDAQVNRPLPAGIQLATASRDFPIDLLVGWQQPDADSLLQNELLQHLHDLAGAAHFLDEALRHSSSGRLDDAAAELYRGMVRAASAEEISEFGAVWEAWIETGIRSGTDPDRLIAELEGALRGAVFAPDDPRPLILNARIEIARVQQSLASSMQQRLPDETAADLDQHLDSPIQLLDRAMASLATQGLKRLECQAWHSLAVAIQSVLQNEPADDAIGKNAYLQSVAAADRLQEALEHDAGVVADFQTFRQREALIAALTARGLLAAEQQDDYQFEAVTAFHQAVDEAVQLPWEHSRFQILGSPLLTTIQRRPDQGGTLMALRERGLRQMLEHLVDGAFSLSFASPDDAVTAFTSGIDGLRESNQTFNQRVIRAADLLPALSGRHERDLHQAMSVYRIMGLTEAGRCDEAVIQALRLIDVTASAEVDGIRIPAIDAQAMARKLDSPLTAYALASALDACVERFGLSESALRPAMLDLSRSALQRGQVLMTPEVREQFPLFDQLLQDLDARLNRPESFLERSRALRQQQRLADATSVIEQGLSRYLNHAALWDALFELEFQKLSYQSPLRTAHPIPARRVDGLVARLNQQIPDEPAALYWTGRWHEVRRRHASALDAYAAVERHERADDQLRRNALTASARVRVLRIAD